MTLKRLFFLAILSSLLFSCCTKKDETKTESPDPEPIPLTYVSGADLSFLPFLEENATKFYDKDGTEENVLDLFKERGMNIVRLKLWYEPETSAASFSEVKAFSERIKAKGLKVWLTVHYSDTWADPGHQETPETWKNLSFPVLKDSVSEYTKRIVQQLQPDIIQIGNEINGGFLWPSGKISENESQFIELMQAGAQAVRAQSSTTQIMIHFAGHEGSDWFYNKMTSIDYDYIGLSYYPWWHGKDMDVLQNQMSSLKSKYQKEVIIAETSYPFTLGWNDWTNNIVGADEHLILPDFTATKEGQKAFLLKLKEKIKLADAFGFCYWAPDWVAWDGPESQRGSSWENQALFDFENKETEAMEVFSIPE